MATAWLVWLYALSLVAVVVLFLLHSPLQRIPSPGFTLIILLPIEVLLGWIAGYRPPPIRHRFAMFGGFAVFFLTFAYDRFRHVEAPGATTTEPLGFLALTWALGLVVSRLVASNETEWRTLTHQIEAARRIQTAILPRGMPEVQGFSVAARYSPMSGVAGDYYCFPETSGGTLNALVADVAGHGAPAALVASMIKVSVFASADKSERPSEIIMDLNRTLCREAPSQLASAVLVTMDYAAKRGSYSAAGHPPVVIWRRTEQRLDSLAEGGLLLGIRPGERFLDYGFQFSSGDRILLYSDGLTEAENPDGVSFGDARLAKFFQESQSLDTEQCASNLMREVLRWSGKDGEAEQEDDITFVIVDLQQDQPEWH